MAEVVAVVLNYKTPDLAVKAAVSAAEAMRELGGVVVIVDNDSRDGSFERMTQAVADLSWPENVPATVLQSGANGGYGAGNNFGIRAGLAQCPKAEFVYVLNPDARVEPDAVAALVNYMSARPEVGIAGSWIYGEDGEDHCSAFRFPSLASEFESTIRFGPVTRLLASSVLPMHVPAQSGAVGWIVGASMMIRAKVLDRIGLFDETFFLYFDETDLCRRARDAGFETHFVRESRVCHIGSVSTGMGTWTRKPRYWFESRWHYLTKHHGRAYAAAATAMNVFGSLLYKVRQLVERKPQVEPDKSLSDLIRHDTAAFFKPLRGSRDVRLSSHKHASTSTGME